MPPHVLMDFVVLPPEHGRSVTDVWGWDAHEAGLRCPDDVSGDIGGCSATRALKPKFCQPTQTMVTVGILPFRENSHGRAGNRTRDLMISSQRLWSLDHVAGQFTNIIIVKIKFHVHRETTINPSKWNWSGVTQSVADLGGRKFRGVDLKPFHFWDRGFESSRRHGYSSLMFVVYCVGSGSCDELITRLEESYRLCVFVSNCVWSRNVKNVAACARFGL